MKPKQKQHKHWTIPPHERNYHWAFPHKNKLSELWSRAGMISDETAMRIFRLETEHG